MTNPIKKIIDQHGEKSDPQVAAKALLEQLETYEKAIQKLFKDVGNTYPVEHEIVKRKLTAIADGTSNVGISHQDILLLGHAQSGLYNMAYDFGGQQTESEQTVQIMSFMKPKKGCEADIEKAMQGYNTKMQKAKLAKEQTQCLAFQLGDFMNAVAASPLFVDSSPSLPARSRTTEM